MAKTTRAGFFLKDNVLLETVGRKLQYANDIFPTVATCILTPSSTHVDLYDLQETFILSYSILLEPSLIDI